MITEQEVDRLLDTVWDACGYDEPQEVTHDEPTELRLTTDPLPQCETAFSVAIVIACFGFLALVAVTELMK